MKASELIDELICMIVKHGDQDVYGYDCADEAYLLVKKHVEFSGDIQLLTKGEVGNTLYLSQFKSGFIV